MPSYVNLSVLAKGQARLLQALAKCRQPLLRFWVPFGIIPAR